MSRDSPRSLPAPEDQAARFAQQREADRTAIAEDYVELIADLLQEEGEARAAVPGGAGGGRQVSRTYSIGDLAHATGVKPTTIRWHDPLARSAGMIGRVGYRHLTAPKAGTAPMPKATSVAWVSSGMRASSASTATPFERMAARCEGAVINECRIIETLADFSHGRCEDTTHRGALRPG